MMKAKIILGAALAVSLGYASSAQAVVFNTSNDSVFLPPFGSLFDTRFHNVDAGDSTAFNKGLNEGYIALSDERGEDWFPNTTWDFVDAEHFKHKARTAARNSLVMPDHPDDRDLEDAHYGMFRDAFDRMHAAFDRGGRYEAASAAATAQVKYDCWIEATEEGRVDDAMACRDAHNAAMADVETAATYTLTGFERYEREQPPEPVAAPVEHSRNFLVYFDFDESDLRSEGRRTVDEGVEAAAVFGDTTLRVIAHTDTSGAIDYNQALSERRANAVIGSLIDAGVEPGRIVSEAVGETQPMVDTGDEIREQANRVAEIDLM